MELLRGRDGLPGRDGPPGRDGEQGPAGPPGPPAPQSGGATYVRWGKNSCPQIPGTEQLYSGITAGARHNAPGGGANHLCMPRDPEYSPNLRYRNNLDEDAIIEAAEYGEPITGAQDHDIPCAVCYVSTRPTVVMIPAKASCPPTWTREYYGYLMAERNGHPHRSMYECVDAAQESVPGSSLNNENSAILVHVEADCSGLPCPPYNKMNEYKELNCVVCTKWWIKTHTFIQLCTF